MNRAIEEAINICGSQTALAKKAGLSQGSIWKYLTGKCKPKYESAQKLSLAVKGEFPAIDFMSSRENITPTTNAQAPNPTTPKPIEVMDDGDKAA